MYQFSRAIFRELAPGVVPPHGEDVTATRMRFLRACEASVERLAMDRHYFAKPVRTLFNDVVRGKVERYREWCTPVYQAVGASR